MFKGENILCNLVRIWLEQYQPHFYITNLQPMGSHHATLNFKDSHDWVITKKKKKVWWEKKNRKVSHISKLHLLLRKGEWILCNFWSVKKVNPKGSSCKSLHTIIQPPSHIAMLQWCLPEIHKTLNFVKEESFKILILTSFCRDPTDINPPSY